MGGPSVQTTAPHVDRTLDHPEQRIPTAVRYPWYEPGNYFDEHAVIVGTYFLPATHDAATLRRVCLSVADDGGTAVHNAARLHVVRMHKTQHMSELVHRWDLSIVVDLRRWPELEGVLIN